jgi:hypothetical protein
LLFTGIAISPNMTWMESDSRINRGSIRCSMKIYSLKVLISVIRFPRNTLS